MLNPKFPKHVIVALQAGSLIPTIVSSVEEAARKNATILGRYKLVGTGTVSTYYDYVEDESAAA